MIDCILNSDCMVTLPTLATDSIQLVLTDIPYGEVNRPSNGLRNLMKGDADIKTFELSPFLAECLRVCSGSFYIFCGTEQVSEIRHTLCIAGLTTRLGIWVKSNPSPMNGQHTWLSGIECCVYGKSVVPPSMNTAKIVCGNSRVFIVNDTPLRNRWHCVNI